MMNKTARTQIPQLSIEMNEYGDGWKWKLYRLGEFVGQFRTNTEGVGLWQWLESGATWMDGSRAVYEWQQITGTCQFSLSKNRASAYATIRRDWSKAEEG